MIALFRLFYTKLCAKIIALLYLSTPKTTGNLKAVLSICLDIFKYDFNFPAIYWTHIGFNSLYFYLQNPIY